MRRQNHTPGERRLRKAIRRIVRHRQARREQRLDRLTKQIRWFLGPGVATVARQLVEIIQGIKDADR